MLFAAEWGDLSQLLTAGLVASGRPAVPVFVGAWIGLTAVAGAGVLLGRVLLRHVRLAVVRYIGAGVCAILGVGDGDLCTGRLDGIADRSTDESTWLMH